MTTAEITLNQRIREHFYHALSQKLAYELYAHNGYEEKHIGLTEDLSLLIDAMTNNHFTLHGIHESCLSGIYQSPDDPSQKLFLACLMFGRKNDSFRYHNGLIIPSGTTLESLRDEVSDRYLRYHDTDLIWTSRKGNTYFVKA